jgi:transposase-like protein
MDTSGIDDLNGSRVVSSTLGLPPADTKRWVARRKASVVAAVCSGALSAQEACRRYRLSLEELLAWQRAVERHGIPGLRVTRLQLYRDPETLKAAE